MNNPDSSTLTIIDPTTMTILAPRADQESLFDYTALPASSLERITKSEDTLRSVGASFVMLEYQMALALFSIADELDRLRMAGHSFSDYMNANTWWLGVNEDQARQYVRIAKSFPSGQVVKALTMRTLNRTALLYLSEEATPETQRRAVMTRALSGEVINASAIRRETTAVLERTAPPAFLAPPTALEPRYPNREWDNAPSIIMNSTRPAPQDAPRTAPLNPSAPPSDAGLGDSTSRPLSATLKTMRVTGDGLATLRVALEGTLHSPDETFEALGLTEGLIVTRKGKAVAAALYLVADALGADFLAGVNNTARADIAAGMKSIASSAGFLALEFEGPA